MDQRLIILNHVSLFQNIPEDKFELVLGCLGAAPKDYKANEILVHISAPMKSAGIVLSGHIEGSMYDESDNLINVNHYCPGDLIGLSHLCAGQLNSPIEISALTDCTVLFINMQNLLSAYDCKCVYKAQVVSNLIQTLAKQDLFLTQKVRILAQKRLRDRIKLYLQSMPVDSNGVITLHFNRTSWAEYLCVDRSALSRELGRMQQEGILTYKGRKIHIMNQEFLRY